MSTEQISPLKNFKKLSKQGRGAFDYALKESEKIMGVINPWSEY